MLIIVVESKTVSIEGSEWSNEYVGTDKQAALSCVHKLRLMDDVIDIRYGFYHELAGAQLVWTDAIAQGTTYPCEIIRITDDDLPF